MEYGSMILASRIAEVRRDLYEARGGRLLARELKIPFRTWANYEAGVVMPAHIRGAASTGGSSAGIRATALVGATMYSA